MKKNKNKIEQHNIATHNIVKQYNILIFIICFLLCNISAFAQFGGGSGIADDPYKIFTSQHLEALADSVNNGTNWSMNKHFILMNNITSPITTIIGPSGGGRSFQGTFDGNDFTITLNIRASDYVGLFGFVRNATISNLNIVGSVNGNYNTGGVAGKSELSKFNNCNNNASISVTNYFGGGIVGNASASNFNDCNNYASVVGGETIGGIVGFVYNDANSACEFNNCSNNASISTLVTAGVRGSQAGGITGSGESSSFNNCVNNGSILGGIGVGGIAGEGSASNFNDCANNGYVRSTNTGAGGIAGIAEPRSRGSNAKGCVNIGSVEANSSAGGIFGYTNGNIIRRTIASNCINSGIIKGNVQVGGIIGYLRTSDIESCINTGIVIASGTQAQYIGAIVGWNYQGTGTVTNCHYDKQMCIYKGIENTDVVGQAEGKLTKEMTGNQLQTKLGTTNWLYNNDIYPMLTTIASKEFSKVAASPIYFCNSTDIHNNLQYNFEASTANDVVWNEANRINIIDNIATLTSLGTDTLVAGIGIYKKEIIITITAMNSCIFHSYFHLEVNANPATGAGTATISGTNSDTGTIQGGTSVMVEAIPDICYYFRNWSHGNGAFVSASNPLNITLYSDTTLTANFELKRFTLILDKEPIIGGVVNGANNYNCGTEVTITAIPDIDYEFIKWTDNKGNFFSSSPSETITMNAEQHYIAHFNRIGTELKHIVNIQSIPTGATFTGAGGYDDNADVTISAEFASSCYTFKNWTDKNHISISEDNPFTFTVKSDTMLIANFDVATFALIVNSTTGGSVTPNGINRRDCNSTTTITATAEHSCYKFKHWADENNNIVSTINPLDVILTKDTQLIANFEWANYKLDIVKNIDQAGTIVAENYVVCNQTTKIIAYANAGYMFSHWSDKNDIFVSSDNPFDITLTCDTILIANYEKINPELFRVDLMSNPAIGGVFTGDGDYEFNDIANISAVANTNYKFLNWTDQNNTIISSNPNFDLTVTQDTFLIANFNDEGKIAESIKLETIKISPNPASKDFIISFDVIRANNMKIVLLDLAGRELVEVYDDFANEGMFIKTIKIEYLARGVYFLNIFIDGNYLTEKIVVE